MDDIKKSNKGNYLFKLVIIVSLFLILIRFFYLQVINSKYKSIALGNAVYKKTIYPDRGIIFDRDNRPLLNNITTYYLIITPFEFKNIDTALFCSIIGMNVPEFKSKLNLLISKNNIYRPITFETIFSKNIVSRLQENMYKFTGIELQERIIRSYPSKVGANLLGYIGEVDSNILKKHSKYLLGDNIGLSGLENYFENTLKGTKGVKCVTRDNKNRYIGSYDNGKQDIQAISGKDLHTFISLPIQELAEKLLKNKIGSIIVSDPTTGGIIAMASGPTYDPNLLSGENRSSNFNFLFKEETSPLLNRCIKGSYSPGSTFKPIASLIGLQENIITPKYSFNCRGIYTYCGKLFKCSHSSSGHASNLQLAISNSCNSYFIHLFRMIVDNPEYKNTSIGLSIWKKYLNNFGLGHKLNIDLPYEDDGYVPDSLRYNKIFSSKWNSCNIASLGIGQGELLLTPLQLLNLSNLIANRGYYYIPHIVSKIENASTEETKILSRYNQKKIVTNIPAEMYDDVINAMEDVVKFGTAASASIPGISVCAKTGTVENERIINGTKVKMPNHSIFIAFAPKENPKISVSVVVENSGGFGATWAAPIASLIIERYLKDTLSQERLEKVDYISNANLIPEYLMQKRRERLSKEKKLNQNIFYNDNYSDFYNTDVSKTKIKKTNTSIIKKPLEIKDSL